MRTQKTPQTIFFISTVALLAAGGILLFALPQRTYSENENRYLTSFEPPSLSAFLDTSMQENLADGANDQFAGRDLWMGLATSLKRAIGLLDIGGVYLGEDGYYFERVLDSGISESRYLNNLRCLEQFAKTYPARTVFLPVPSKGTVLKNKLPKNAVLYDAGRLYGQAGDMLAQADFFDVQHELANGAGDSQIYFKTDHHWTMQAAFLTYKAWCSRYGEKYVPLEQFEPTCVSKSFYGTLYSKAPDFCTQPDQFLIPKKLPKAEVTIDSKKSGSIYDMHKLETKDKYAVYFGGNFARIDIRMQPDAQGTAKRKLLVIKDSFANSIVPFFMENYDEIIMLDLRYFNQPVSKLMEEEQPDEALILYEMVNFAQDMNFFKILK